MQLVVDTQGSACCALTMGQVLYPRGPLESCSGAPTRSQAVHPFRQLIVDRLHQTLCFRFRRKADRWHVMAPYI